MEKALVSSDIAENATFQWTQISFFIQAGFYIEKLARNLNISSNGPFISERPIMTPQF